jgi:hypothetical protein
VAPGGLVPGWNIYSPKFAPVRVVALKANANANATIAATAMANQTNHVLQLRDSDPHDFAKAERVFPRTAADSTLTVSFDVMAVADQAAARGGADHLAAAAATLEVDLWSRTRGAYRPGRIWFVDDG